MKKARSRREQAVAVARLKAAVRLQSHPPKVHRDRTTYDRNRAKRLWPKDREALSPLRSLTFLVIRY